jgi:hypothetical protein
LVSKLRENKLLYSSHLPLGVPNGLVIHHASDFQTLSSNAGLEHFIDGEPPQYVKLTMSVVQDFRFSWSTSNPMVHYKIYNKSVDLPLDVFYTAIRVPQWGSRKKIMGQPRPLLELYEEICQGRSFTGEGGKI